MNKTKQEISLNYIAIFIFLVVFSAGSFFLGEHFSESLDIRGKVWLISISPWVLGCAVLTIIENNFRRKGFFWSVMPAVAEIFLLYGVTTIIGFYLKYNLVYGIGFYIIYSFIRMVNSNLPFFDYRKRQVEGYLEQEHAASNWWKNEDLLCMGEKDGDLTVVDDNRGGFITAGGMEGLSSVDYQEDAREEMPSPDITGDITEEIPQEVPDFDAVEKSFQLQAKLAEKENGVRSMPSGGTLNEFQIYTPPDPDADPSGILIKEFEIPDHLSRKGADEIPALNYNKEEFIPINTGEKMLDVMNEAVMDMMNLFNMRVRIPVKLKIITAEERAADITKKFKLSYRVEKEGQSIINITAPLVKGVSYAILMSNLAEIWFTENVHENFEEHKVGFAFWIVYKCARAREFYDTAIKATKQNPKEFNTIRRFEEKVGEHGVFYRVTKGHYPSGFFAEGLMNETIDGSTPVVIDESPLEQEDLPESGKRKKIPDVIQMDLPKRDD